MIILNKVVSVRATDIWQTWLEELAGQAQRSPGAFLRDVIYCLKFTDQGASVIDTLIDRGFDYSAFAKLTRERG